jgi:uncharacterized membrane protein
MVDVSGTPVAPLRAQRVGDEERQRAAEILADQHARGRLSPEEFETRLGAAFAAETTTDLGRVLADLPIRAPAGSPPSRWRPPSELRWILGGFVAVLAVGIVVGVVIEAGRFFSPWWLDNLIWLLRDNPWYLMLAFVSGTAGFVLGAAVGRRRARREVSSHTSSD